MNRPVTIGVLAIQGDFAAHIKAFENVGVTAREIRRAEQFDEIDGLVLPGGETTTMIKLLKIFDLWDRLRELPARGIPIFGTCAGLLLLAEQVTNPRQDSLALLPIEVERNAYGRQVDSFSAPGSIRWPADLELTVSESIIETEFIFIRAPRITALNSEVEVLARHDGTPVLVRKGLILGGSFHPEIACDGIVPRLFTSMVMAARDMRLDPSSCN